MNPDDELPLEDQEDEFTWEEIVRANKPWYLSLWRNALRELLGWSDARIDQWAKQYGDRLNGSDLEFYHNSPQRYVVRVITPDRLKERLVGPAIIEYIKRMEAAVGADPSDLANVRNRVNRVLSDYGETLPDKE